MKAFSGRAWIPIAGAWLSVWMSASAAEENDWLQSWRRTDLNDYALGAMLMVSENPYAGTDTGIYAFPYLTALHYPDFTKNTLVIKDGNLGLRYVTENDNWEFGAYGRVQTLGLGAADNEELLGLNERRWTLEIAPFIGWRRLPVKVEFRPYWELLGHHDGWTGELVFSLPKEFSWGYVAPSVQLAYLSDQYSEYYFGVSRKEAVEGRPEYEPGDALNPSAAFRIGYRLSPHWFLTGKIGYEWLDSTITDSPIVDKDGTWSGSVGVAYNANVFRSTARRDPDADRSLALEVRLQGARSTIDSRVRRDSEDGRPGNEVDVEDVLGVPDDETVYKLDTVIRFGYYHRVHLGLFELSRQANETLDRDISFGDETFTAGTRVDTRQNTQTFQLQYGYSLLRDGQKELGLTAGVHYTRIDARLKAAETGQSERIDANTPLPTVGAFGSVGFGANWSVAADAQLFSLNFDRFEGNMAYANVRLERDIGRNFNAGLGFNYYHTNLDGRDGVRRTRYKATRYGPLFYVGMKF